MSNKLITLDQVQTFEITLSNGDKQLIESALAASALVGKVNDAISQAAAFSAQKELKIVLDKIEQDRTDMKAPVLEYGRAIDAHAKSTKADVEAEYLRVGKLLGSFTALERLKQDAAKQIADEELRAITVRTQTALQNARNEEEEEAIRQRQTQECEMVRSVPPITKVEGQSVKDVWIIDRVTDIHALYKEFPECVKLEILEGAAKKLLEAGKKLPGVVAHKEISSTVRKNNKPILELAN